MVYSSRKKKLTIAIDGPSGAGKSTVGKALARRLGYVYIDTGAMYRAVALKAREKGTLSSDEGELRRWVSALILAFVPQGEESRILCNGDDVTEAIRSPEMSLLASEISKREGVREALVEKQREMGREGGVVLDGRDIGTVVFPFADVKFYLDANPAERARRRHQELAEKGSDVSFESTLEEVVKRDHNDINRAISPLKKAEDAIFVDSTSRSAEEVVDEMMRVVMAGQTDGSHR
jgi:CMP/dCMP kinase